MPSECPISLFVKPRAISPSTSLCRTVIDSADRAACDRGFVTTKFPLRA
jgi:hypothetical protein